MIVPVPVHCFSLTFNKYIASMFERWVLLHSKYDSPTFGKGQKLLSNLVYLTLWSIIACIGRHVTASLRTRHNSDNTYVKQLRWRMHLWRNSEKILILFKRQPSNVGRKRIYHEGKVLIDTVYSLASLDLHIFSTQFTF